MTHRDRDKPRIRDKMRSLFYELGTIARRYFERNQAPNCALEHHAKRTRVRRDRVPRVGEYVLYLLLPRKDRDPIIGDLRELYADTIKPKFGPVAARWWYWTQVVKSLGALMPVSIVRWAALAAGLLRWRS
jgi:hypothetical protein